MVTAYSPILKLALPVQGELSGTWGDVVNDNITSMVEQAIAGRAVIDTWTVDSHTLTTANGTTSESRCAMLELTDTGTALTGAGTVICPAASKIYIVKNAAGQNITVKTSAGTGILVPNGRTTFLFCDGTNVVEAMTHTTSMQLGTSTVVTAVLDEDNMASDSATALATQQSIKAYVDAQVGANNELSEVLANGNTTGGNDIAFDDNDKAIFGAGSDLQIYHDGDNSIISDTSTGNLQLITNGNAIALKSSDGEAMISAIKDGDVKLYYDDALKLATTSTGIDVTGTAVVDGLTAPTADIDGGTIDGTVIGGTTAAAGSFTTVGATGNITSEGQVITDTINEQTATSGVTVDGVLLKDGGATFTGNVSFGDNDKAIFGAGSDLQIYHDTSASYISDQGSGPLNVLGSQVNIYNAVEDTQFASWNASAAKTYIDGSLVTNTTSTGIDVTGTVTADGLTVSGTGVVASLDRTDADTLIELKRAGSVQAYIGSNTSGDVRFYNSSVAKKLQLSSNGDISFYDSAGSSQAFFWDASAESLGIGTTSINSLASLHIQGSDGASGASVNIAANEFFIDNNGNTGMTLGSSNTGTGYYAFADSDVAIRGGIFYDHSTDDMGFRVGSGTRMTIDASGNVGIGTDSPEVQLETFGAAQTYNFNAGTDPLANFAIINDNVNSGTGPAIVLGSTYSGSATVANARIFAERQSTGGTNAGATDLIFEVGQASGSALAERMRIDSSGNVDVTGTVTADGLTVDAPNVTFSGGNFLLNIEDTNAGGSTGIRTRNSLGNETTRIAADDGNDLSFYTTSSVTKRMEIAGNGDISFYEDTGSTPKFFWDSSAESLGIGTSSPASPLHIYNSSPFIRLTDADLDTRHAIIGGQNGNFTIDIDPNQTAAASLFSVDIDNTERMRINSSGNVGIGTSSPNYKLVVSNGGAAGIEFGPEYASDTNLVQHYDRTANAYMDVNNIAQNHRFGRGSSEWMRITSSGNVGIGTSSPTRALHVNSGASNEVARFESTDTEALIELVDTTGSAQIRSRNDFRFYTNGGSTRAMDIDASGNVGIGTSSPAHKLHVADATTPEIIVEDTTNNVKAVLGADNSVGRIGTDTNHPVTFRTNDTERMRIDSSGNVGIGESSPTVRLDVRDSIADTTSSKASNSILSVVNEDTTSTAASMLVLRSHQGDGVRERAILEAGLEDTSGGYLGFWTRPSGSAITEKMRIDADGNVGIGTDAPTGDLDIYRSSSDPDIRITRGTTQSRIATTSAGGLRLQADYGDTAADSFIQFSVDGNEAARIDSSGNLLVGKASAGVANEGAALTAGGYLEAARDGGVVGYFNRLSTDGNIVSFRKDNTTVGSIGTEGGNLNIDGGAAKVGLQFRGAEIRPRDGGVAVDGTVDLGSSTNRFKDLYLSGGVYLGGTGAANKLDDYEEGIYIPTITCSTSGSITLNIGYDELAYTKIGNTVHVHGRIRISSVSSPVGTARLSLPFTSANLAGDAGRVSGLCYLQNATNNINEYGIHPTVESNAYVDIARMSGSAFNTTIADEFSGNELLFVSITYRAA